MHHSTSTLVVAWVSVQKVSSVKEEPRSRHCLSLFNKRWKSTSWWGCGWVLKGRGKGRKSHSLSVCDLLNIKRDNATQDLFYNIFLRCLTVKVFLPYSTLTRYFRVEYCFHEWILFCFCYLCFCLFIYFYYLVLEYFFSLSVISSHTA